MEVFGACSAPNPSVVVANCEVLITILPDSPKVKQIVLGENGFWRD